MSASLLLYSNSQSRGRIARWMLEEIGEPYQVQYLAYGEDMHSDEFRSINPMGKVPALVHLDHVVTEAAAICAYLADTFPHRALAPAPGQRADYYRWLFFAAGPLEAALTNHALAFETQEDKSSMLGYGSYERVVDVLEDACQRHTWIAGNEFTAADVYVGSHVIWGMQFGTLETRPAFEDYRARLTRREACIRAAELDDTETPAGGGDGACAA
ncbi:MAG: glutathione S-transferase [Gammaproteobacteria bacterium]|nr:MAG: glutathione S-transferase [Gammaproteobacteria bacterium]